MDFLRVLEGLRTPFGDGFFSLITHLGEETLFIVAALTVYWCVSKRQGIYLICVGFLGTAVNQFLKLLFRVPRPWVLDESFTIVESARAEATGYSFPSGHTQSSVGVFGCLGYVARRRWWRAVCIALCILVPFSRMYLGVHTPKDVLVSAALALLMVFALPPIMDRLLQKKHGMHFLFGALTALSVLSLLFMLSYPYPADMDADMYQNGLNNTAKIIGCFLGVWLGWMVEDKYVGFDQAAPLFVQALKLCGGFAVVLAIKILAKAPLLALFGAAPPASAVRYFLIAFFAAGVWPMSFRYMKRQ